MEKYRKGLLTSQHTAYSVNQDSEVLRSVIVPTSKGVPLGKFVAKINLAEMAPPKPGSPAYPDPLLLAYKSSVNWTRQWGFQMMAEAEPQEDVIDPNGQLPGFIFTDQGSKASSDQGSIPYNLSK